MRFVLGGTDLGLYPGFSGLITRPFVRVGPPSYVSTDK